MTWFWQIVSFEYLWAPTSAPTFNPTAGPTETPCPTVVHALDSSETMSANNWDVSGVNAINNAARETSCGDGAGTNFFGWNQGLDEGTVSYTFTDDGTFDVEFANCWYTGNVYLHYDDNSDGTSTVLGNSTISKWNHVP